VHGGEEVSRGLVVTGGDRAILLQPGEEVLDQVPRRVEVAIEFSGLLPIGLRWDHRLLAGGREWLEDPFIGIECFVGDQHASLHVGQQCVRADEVMGLTAGQVEPNGIAKGIHQGMYFRAQSTA
jgi:hypothetical protein